MEWHIYYIANNCVIFFFLKKMHNEYFIPAALNSGKNSFKHRNSVQYNIILQKD